MSGDLTARDAVAREVHLQVPTLQHGPIGTEFVADAVLAALAAAGWRLVRGDQLDCSYCGDYLDDGCPVHGGEGKGLPDNHWEWGVRSARTGMVNRMPDEAGARRYAIGWGEAVRRRGSVPPGEWEVAP